MRHAAARPPIDPDAPFVKVPLNHGKVALVSPEDAERVLRHRWYGKRRVRNGRVSWEAKSALWIDGKQVTTALHRFILGYGPNDPQVDHKNGNGLDCRRGNIREATRSQQQYNRRKRTALPYRGVARNSGRWKAVICAEGVDYYLGTFDAPEEAARAYDDAARRLHGEFACLNFPQEGERRAR